MKVRVPSFIEDDTSIFLPGFRVAEAISASFRGKRFSDLVGKKHRKVYFVSVAKTLSNCQMQF